MRRLAGLVARLGAWRGARLGAWRGAWRGARRGGTGPAGREPTVASVERAAFRALFASRRPVSLDRLAAGMGCSPETVEPLVAEIERRGELIRGGDGAIVAIAGLSLAPTRHVVVAGGVPRWTWCAWDALGIGALLGRGVAVRSLCPQTGAAIEVRFTRWRTVSRPGSAVLLIRPRPQPCRTVDDWCPTVNLLASGPAAMAWMDHSGVRAEIAPIAVAARRGAAGYRELLHPLP